MKLLLYIVIILSFIFTSCGGERTEEDLAQEVMQAFTDDNHRALKQLYVTKSDVESLINESSIPDDMKQNAKRDLKAKTTFFKLLNKLRFNSTRFRAFENGVNWQDVEIIKVHSRKTDYSFFNFSARFMETYDLEVLDIDAEFVSNKDTFIMYLDDCIKTGRGWCLTEDIHFRRKSYYNNFR